MVDPSILFSGIHFDKKKFATDFKKFEKKHHGTLDSNGNNHQVDIVHSSASFDDSVSNGKRKRNNTGTEEASSNGTKKKKTLKQPDEKLSANVLFKPLSGLPELEAPTENDEEDSKINKKKAEAKAIEEAALLRKQYRIHVAGHNVPPPLKGFEDLRKHYGCKSFIMKNIKEAGYKEPTPIQRQAIPVLLSERECFACAQTGSGKTLAFAIPILMKLKSPSKDGIRAVILCPTRELAKQITLEFKNIAKGRKFRIRLMTKALSRCADFQNLPCDVLVTTPLRLDYVLNNSEVDLSKVEFLVLDESDKLFELGFVEQIDAVVNACSNPKILRSLFSATLPDTVEELARSIMHDAVRIVVGEKNSASQTIKQKLVFVGSEEGKLLALRQIFREGFNPPVLVFVQSKDRAKELYRELFYDDVKVDRIHAYLTQAQREKAVENFREGKTWVLIATDLLARGMDFKGVNCVINFDFPRTTATYIHRIGRTGRAGRQGEAITFYTEDNLPFLRPIVNVIVASGGEVPSWMLSIRKLRRKRHSQNPDSKTKSKSQQTAKAEKTKAKNTTKSIGNHIVAGKSLKTKVPKSSAGSNEKVIKGLKTIKKVSGKNSNANRG